jgi:hypothetical protein
MEMLHALFEVKTEVLAYLQLRVQESHTWLRHVPRRGRRKKKSDTS